MLRHDYIKWLTLASLSANRIHACGRQFTTVKYRKELFRRAYPLFWVPQNDINILESVNYTRTTKLKRQFSPLAPPKRCVVTADYRVARLLASGAFHLQTCIASHPNWLRYAWKRRTGEADISKKKKPFLSYCCQCCEVKPAILQTF